MKKTSIVLGLMINILAVGNAYAGKGDVSPGLNQCSPVMDSKVYSTTDFHAYPRPVVFECSYKCNVNGRIDTVKGTTKTVVNNMQEDAAGTTCQGVLMKKVPWGWDFDKVEPFYAPETSIPQLKNWAFQNINFNPKVNQLERARLEELKKDLYTVASSYIMAGIHGGPSAAYFKDAGIKLSEIADGLPMDTRLLEEEIRQIVVNKGQRGAPGTVDFLNTPMILNSAAWRIPSHLFK